MFIHETDVRRSRDQNTTAVCQLTIATYCCCFCCCSCCRRLVSLSEHNAGVDEPPFEPSAAIRLTPIEESSFCGRFQVNARVLHRISLFSFHGLKFVHGRHGRPQHVEWTGPRWVNTPRHDCSWSPKGYFDDPVGFESLRAGEGRRWTKREVVGRL